MAKRIRSVRSGLGLWRAARSSAPAGWPGAVSPGCIGPVPRRRPRLGGARRRQHRTSSPPPRRGEGGGTAATYGRVRESASPVAGRRHRVTASPRRQDVGHTSAGSLQAYSGKPDASSRWVRLRRWHRAHPSSEATGPSHEGWPTTTRVLAARARRPPSRARYGALPRRHGPRRQAPDGPVLAIVAASTAATPAPGGQSRTAEATSAPARATQCSRSPPVVLSSGLPAALTGQGRGGAARRCDDGPADTAHDPPHRGLPRPRGVAAAHGGRVVLLPPPAAKAATTTTAAAASGDQRVPPISRTAAPQGGGGRAAHDDALSATAPGARPVVALAPGEEVDAGPPWRDCHQSSGPAAQATAAPPGPGVRRWHAGGVRPAAARPR